MILNSVPRKYVNNEATKKIEIKVKEKDKLWEKTAAYVVIDTEVVNQDEAKEKADNVAQGLAELLGKKVRWCFIGVEQGHYKHAKERNYMNN